MEDHQTLLFVEEKQEKENLNNAKTSVWMPPKDLRGPTVTIRLVVYAKTCFFGLIQLSHS